MRSARSATFWRCAALGFGVMAVFNAILLVCAWTNFAIARPDYIAQEWPTFSRVLTLQQDLYKWLAGAAGAGIFAGASARAAMQWQVMKAHPQLRGPLMGTFLCAVLATPLGLVNYFHVAVTLSANNDLHMALSYLFFFGMTFMIVGDIVFSMAAAKAGRRDAKTPSARRLDAHHRAGFAVLAAGIVFLATFFLKNVAWNPWRATTQKVFVIAETSWIVLAHVCALFYMKEVRSYFAVANSAVAVRARNYASTTALIAIAAAACAALAAPETRAAEAAAAIGGTGRIQPAGGVIVVSAPPGRSVEQVLVREGEHVRKGALLLALSDRPVRVLERDLAAERVRNAERQSIERRKAAALQLETAKLTLAQARTDAAAIAGLDERTFPAREKRQRDNAVSQANVGVQQAAAQLDDAHKASDAELRIARMNLKLAEAALVATRVVAPTDATVLEVHVQPGSGTGGPAVTLADTSHMYVVADFFEGDLPRLAAGQRVKVSNNALGQTLEGAIERIGRVIDPVNRLAKVWVRLDKSAPADRFIGMQVDVKVDGTAAPKDRRS